MYIYIYIYSTEVVSEQVRQGRQIGVLEGEKKAQESEIKAPLRRVINVTILIITTTNYYDY